MQGEAPRRWTPCQMALAKTKLALGSPEITASALASQPAKTLDPRDSAWKA